MTRTPARSGGRENGRSKPPVASKPPMAVRCAIYTRKSSEEGLEQDFNSLDAQRESAENYIASQAGEGWECLPDRYDDGGFTVHARIPARAAANGRV
jgi:site-specific DNA recombinase